MKLRVLRLGFALAALVGCGGDDGVSVEEAIASKPTLFGLGVSISDIPLTHPVQPQLFVEYGLPVTSGEGGAKNIATTLAIARFCCSMTVFVKPFMMRLMTTYSSGKPILATTAFLMTDSGIVLVASLSN